MNSTPHEFAKHIQNVKLSDCAEWDQGQTYTIQITWAHDEPHNINKTAVQLGSTNEQRSQCMITSEGGRGTTNKLSLVVPNLFKNVFIFSLDILAWFNPKEKAFANLIQDVTHFYQHVNKDSWFRRQNMLGLGVGLTIILNMVELCRESSWRWDCNIVRTNSASSFAKAQLLPREEQMIVE